MWYLFIPKSFLPPYGHTPFQEAQPSSPTHISTSSIPTVIPIPTVTQSEPTPLRKNTRRVRIAQSSALPPIADEPASPVRDVSKEEACPTDSGFIADQDRAIIAKSSTLPHDTAPRVTSPAAVEGSMQQTINELTTLCTSLQRQHSELLIQFQAQKVEINKLNASVKILEDNQGVIGTRSADDTPIKGRRIDEEEGITGRVSSDKEEIKMYEGEVAVERTSEDIKEMTTVLTFMDAATVLAGGIDVPTGSYSISTAGPPVVDIHTCSDAFPLPEETSHCLKKNATARRKVLPLPEEKCYHCQKFALLSLSKKNRQSKMTVSYRLVPHVPPFILAVTVKCNIVYKDSFTTNSTTNSIEEVYVQALQVKHPIIDWKVHIEGQRSYWKIIRLGGSSACYQFFVDLLKHLDREDLNQL
nr:hypothetical protein [Tanacetum cinerariifolium]